MFSVLSGTAAIALAGGYHMVSLSMILFSCFLGFYREGSLVPRFLKKPLLINAVLLLYALIFILDTILMRDPVSSLTRLLTFLLIIKILTIQIKRDCLLILLLAFVQVTLAASLTTDLTFIMTFLCFLFFSISALVVFSQGERPHLWKLSVRYFFSASLLGFLFFFIIPHYGIGYFGTRTRSAERETGFSERVDLGDIGKVKKSSRIVMRVELPFTFRHGESLRYRGMVFDRYDGLSWEKAEHDLEKLRRKGKEMALNDVRIPARMRLRQIISLEPIDTTTIFYAGEPLSISTSDVRTVFVDHYGDLSFSFKRRSRVRYEVVSVLPYYERDDLERVDWSDFPKEISETYLFLPEMDEEIDLLARSLKSTVENQYELCKKMEAYLSRSCYYSLDTSGMDPSQPLKSFLIDKKGGDCEFFATSMAVMLRRLGIPSRVVGGYLGGEYSLFSGRYVIRQSNAHLWVEVFFNGIGWVTFDPTPPEYAVFTSRGLLSHLTSFGDFVELFWDTYIISLDLRDQTNFFGRMVEYGYLSYASGKSFGRQAIVTLQKIFKERVVPSIEELGFMVLVVMGVLAFSLFLFFIIWRIGKREKTRGRCPVDFYEKFLLSMKKKGFRKKPWQTPREFQEELTVSIRRSSLAAKELFVDDVEMVTDLYYTIRFGNKAIDESEKKKLIRRLRHLKRTERF
jgi:hypothetical protein